MIARARKKKSEQQALNLQQAKIDLEHNPFNVTKQESVSELEAQIKN